MSTLIIKKITNSSTDKECSVVLLALMRDDRLMTGLSSSIFIHHNAGSVRVCIIILEIYYFLFIILQKTKVVKMINLISTLAHQRLLINMKKPYAITTNHCHVICMDVQAPTRDEKIKIIFVLLFCKNVLCNNTL